MYTTKIASHLIAAATQAAPADTVRRRPLPPVAQNGTCDTGRIVLGGGFRLAAERASK